jgi:hypothetical protein
VDGVDLGTAEATIDIGTDGLYGTAVLSGITAGGTIRGSAYTTEELILRILRNRQELNPNTGTFTLYDDDDVTVLFVADAWADQAGTIRYSGGVLRRIDRLM